MGYTNVTDYEGGKQDWIDAGYPVVGRHAHQHQSETKDATTNPIIKGEDVA
jgi:hypothetical protein